jgi:amino acid adenylation domain-containing protein
MKSLERLESAQLASIHQVNPEATLAQLLAASFLKTPDASALTFGDTTLTYAQLDARSAALAAELRQRGVRKDSFVVIALPRSIDAVVAIVATIRAGGACVPLNLDDRTELHKEIIGESGPIVMLGETRIGTTPLLKPADWPLSGSCPDPSLVGPSDLALVLFTSGSTGKPKGVLLEHGALINSLTFAIGSLGFGPGETFLHKSPLTFDISVWEVLVPLLSGGEIIIAREGVQRDPREILSLIRRHNIETVFFVPTMLSMFLDVLEEEPRLKIARVIAGGEELKVAQRARVHRLMQTEFYNIYGPTEATVCVTIWPASEADMSDPLPIGLPVWNTQLYVLNDEGDVLPPGEIGRLWLAGRQLARGYLNQDALTAERFVDNPFIPGTRMYDSGDLAAWREDGALIYHGRADTQIKLRGIRLELGEVEAALEAQPGIKQAAVIARDDLAHSETRLVAFCMGHARDETELRAALKKDLPIHAMPSRIIFVENYPTTKSGKIDRQALKLLKLEGPQTSPDSLPIQTDAKALIAQKLAEILGCDALSLDHSANFFDLGTNSLQLVQLREALRDELNLDFPISDFFLYTTINQLAQHLDGDRPEPADARPIAKDKAPTTDLIAIVGMAGRFPGAASVSELWQGLMDGREMISHFSKDELDIDPREADPNTNYVLSRGTMIEPAMFDAKHFGIPPNEADRLDPQHRIMLEVAQTALEDAGHDPDRFSGKIGIFCGASQSSYLLNNLLSSPGASRDLAAGYPVKDFATTLGNDKDFLATRLAYKLNLKGPALTVQSACSTALTAVSQACAALQRGQADMVLAGGVSVTFPTNRPYPYLPEGMASADGHCRSFDADATGTVFGDGAGLVVLRRLDDALADGDEIIAVIRGIGINNDGADKAGYAAPSIRAQADAISSAHKAARIDPSQIGYVEAHGTATSLGDPIEFAALQSAFGTNTKDKQYCALGTIKTNIGHLDVAAGVAGLIKTALVLKHGKIPPLLHYSKPNPQIDFANSAFYPVEKLIEWGPSEIPRFAGVSALGVGGTNVHVVLQEAPTQDRSADPDKHNGPRIFPISGSSPEAVAQSISNLASFSAANPQADPDRVVATLRRGRREFEQRRVLVARDMHELAHVAASDQAKSIKSANRARLAFLLPGQGAQHVGMAQNLYAEAPVFREALSLCTELLEPELGLNLLDIIHPSTSDAADMTNRLRDTSLAQPAIFAVSYALAKQWDHWGVTPDAMIGHSIGEFAAATLSGVMGLRDALHLIALRGRLMADLETGVMLSVRASEQEIMPYLGAGLDLAAVNGAKAVVLAGSHEAAEEIIVKIEADGYITSRLHTSHAFHSHMMDPALAPFKAALDAMALHAPQVPILSTVTGDWLTDSEAKDPAYWANHMRKPVRFYDAVQKLWSDGQHMFLETGPGRTLSTLAAQNPERSRAQPAIASLPDPKAENADSYVAMLEGFGQLWAHGYGIDWRKLDEGRPEARRLFNLPTYPFQRTRHWVEPTEIAFRTEPNTIDATPEIEPFAIAQTDAPTAVRAMLFELSGVDPSDMDGTASFFDLGFDSLMLTQATREISDRFGVSITLRELINGYPTIDALSEHIDANGTLTNAPPADKTKVGWMADIERPDPKIKPAGTSAPVTEISRELTELDPIQQDHIDNLVRRFNARTAKSKALTQHYRPYHADPRTASGFNGLWKEAVYQIVSDRSKGSRFLDIDGNEYVDLLNGFGPGFLGHSHDVVSNAVAERLARGYEVGPQHLEAMEAAKLFCEVTGNERTSFVCTGSEAVYAAMRLARTATNRDKIVVFERDYHGNFDEVLVRSIDGPDGPRTLPLTPGIPRDSIKNVVVLPYGTAASLEWIRKNADSLAAVIVEPVQSRRPEFRPVDFIREIRRITELSGTLMVFDEVVTGFRFGPRGAQGYFGVDADLVTYGKVIGGEMPVGVVSGKARYMDTFDGGHWSYGDDSFPEAPVTFFAGTFVRHPLAMAAVRAMLTYLKAQPDLFWRAINAKGDKLAGTIDRWFEDNDMPFEMPNCGSLMYLRIGEDQKFGALLGVHLRARGLFLLEGFPSYLTAAHDDEDISFAVDAIQDAALEMRGAGLLTGRDTVPFDGPHIHSAPPRLSLPDGPMIIAKQMAQPVSRQEIPSTIAQQEVWAAQALEPDLAAGFNENYAIELRGSGIDIEQLHQAATEACARHDALTATFSADGMSAMLGTTTPEIVQLDVSQDPDPAASVAEIWDIEANRPFDLNTGPLARFKIIKRGDAAVDLTITAHHIVFDGWSGGTILRDICRLYDAKRKGSMPDLPEISSPAVYVQAEQDWINSDAGRNATTYWKKKFSDLPVATTLPSFSPRGAVRETASRRLDIEIPAKQVAEFRAVAKQMGVSLFTLLFSAFNLFVARMASTEDVTIGVPSAGQPVYQLENLVFHCVNLMPVRNQVNAREDFTSFVQRVSDTVLTASEHQQLTYGSIVRALNIPRDASQTPLTSMMFNLDPAFTEAELDFSGVPATYRSIPRPFSNFEIDLNLSDKGTVIVAEWTYQTSLFDEARINDFMESFLVILNRTCAQPEISVDILLSATDEESTDLITASHGPVLDIPDASLHDLIARQVAIHPDKIAVEAPDGTLTYAQLDALSNRLAHTLLAHGIKRGDRVGIAVNRSVSAIVCLLGAIKSGAAYLPLDTTLPPERLQYMVRDSGATLVIADARAQSIFAASPAAVLTLDDGELLENPTAPHVEVAPEDLAYVLYTSGSSGRPKGVEVSHRAFVNFIGSVARRPGLRAHQRVLAVTTLSFDIAGLEVWGPLINGGTIVMVNTKEMPDMSALMAKIETCDLMQATPATYHLLLEAGWKGKPDLVALIGGEPVAANMAEALVARCGEVWNMYGPTETTVWSTLSRMDGHRVQVGRPIANTKLRIVDPETLRMLPPGAVGELLIGGEGLARGYHNQPELTQSSFITVAQKTGYARYYRTGDLARFFKHKDEWNLEILGRKDSQIKLRGYRIELQEIENALQRLEGIARAAVILKGAGTVDARLVAAVTSVPDAQIDPRTLRATLAESLPDYMLPSLIQCVDTLPLNSSGKIDRHALGTLLETQKQTSEIGYEETLTQQEHRLIEIWQAFFPDHKIGPNDNFFDLGGHSLLAAGLFERIRNDMGYDLPIASLLRHQTPRSLAASLSNSDLLQTEASSEKTVIDIEGDWDTTTVIHPGPEDEKHTPYFIVGGVGGNVNNLFELGQRLGRIRPVIGFQTRGVMGHRPHTTIEAMAAENIGYLRQYQPKGPYILAGYSGGAYTALEMARQLEEMGEDVKHLGVIDIYAPLFRDKLMQVYRPNLQDRLSDELELLRGNGIATFARRIKATLRKKSAIYMNKWGIKSLSLAETRNLIMRDVWLSAARKYKGGKIEGPITLFTTEPVSMKRLDVIATQIDPTLGWAELTSHRDFSLKQLDGNHLSILTSERVKLTAIALEMAISSSSPGDAS